MASLYVWPYFGVTRGDAKYLTEEDRKTRGAREVVLEIQADDFKGATRRAKDILQGVKLDERVWECGISGIWEKRLDC